MRVASALLALALAVPLHAQEQLTAADYGRAERFLADNTSSMVFGANVRAEWLDGGSFWYINDIPEGQEVVVVDPTRGRRARAFDHARLAQALGAASGVSTQAFALPLDGVEFDGTRLTLDMEGGRFRCDVSAYRCQAVASEDVFDRRSEVLSPDGSLAAFIRDNNLWVRNVDSGVESRLTQDGVQDFGYATNNAGWARSPRPVVLWSPDSRKIATFQHDARGVGTMTLVRTEVGHPEVDTWHYPLPEDSVIFRISRVIVDLDRPAGNQVVRLQMPPDQHRSTCSDHIVCGGTFGDVQWSDDSRRLAFVSSSRDHKRATLRIADAATGAVRDVLEEVEETFYESGYNGPNWRFLSGSDEVIWFSQRKDWGHLYLYGLDGTLKRQVTTGDWNVLEILSVDTDARALTVMGNEREPGDPYFQYAYRVSLDGGEPLLLTPDSANHSVSLSPDGRYLVDQWSTPVVPPVAVVRDMTGREVMPVQTADISRLAASGWQPPLPFSVKARDGQTDLYGLLFKPLNFDPNEKYPVINYLYPGPQSGSVGSRSFRASHRDFQSLAELGFVVIELDAMGTPMRSKTFHEAYYGNMGDNGLEDQVGGIRQLAERYPWIDLDNVGIYGHSGGGFASTAGILTYPDFYKVAVSQAGNHDNRNYEDDWGEKWQGLLEEYPDGTTNYDNQANQLKAANLKGKLLIAHGTLDDNVPPSNTMLVVDALIAANKDFDLLLLPNRRHGFGNEPYMMRRRWDYFVRHLLHKLPPEGYEIGASRPIS